MNEPAKINPMMMSVDVGYEPEDMAKKYVQAFNESGGFLIQEYKVREPTEAEIENAKKHLPVGDLQKKDNKWFTQMKNEQGKIVTKRVFVLHPIKVERQPKNIEDMKLEKAKTKLSSIKGGKNG